MAKIAKLDIMVTAYCATVSSNNTVVKHIAIVSMDTCVCLLRMVYRNANKEIEEHGKSEENPRILV